jgi:hypothetical protein
VGGQAVVLKSETYHFHRLDLTRQAGFIVTIYDEDGLRLAATAPLATPAEAFSEARKIVDHKVEGPKK